MIKIENVVTPSNAQWRAAIIGMRNSYNSWDKSDTDFSRNIITIIGKNDLKLMKQLCKSGSSHRKFMRMLSVYVDIIAPLYWWKEQETYKIGTVANSCSTMHKITDKEFTLNDFSHEYMIAGIPYLDQQNETIILPGALEELECIIAVLNRLRNIYINGLYGSDIVPNIEPKNKNAWYSIIQLLPESYNQKRTVMLNYEVLINIYHDRKNHRLKEWHTFCSWIETLPYSELITGEEKKEMKDNADD